MDDTTQDSSTEEKVSTVKTFAELMDGIDDFESLTPESMEDVYASTFQIKDGEIVNGTIVGFESDFILVDVGYKSEGLVPRLEFPSRGSELNVGDPVEVFVENCEDEDGVLVVVVFVVVVVLLFCFCFSCLFFFLFLLHLLL